MSRDKRTITTKVVQTTITVSKTDMGIPSEVAIALDTGETIELHREWIHHFWTTCPRDLTVWIKALGED